VLTLTPGAGQDLVDRFKRAWERLDVDAAVALFSDDAEYRVDPFEATLTGANAIRAYWNDVAASQTHVEFDAERVWVSGPTVLASWHAAFTTLELDEAGLVTRFREWAIERTVGVDRTYRPEAG